MFNDQTSLLNIENCFHLPFKPGTRVLTETILNQYSEFRLPKRVYLSIKTRAISFNNEWLTMGIILDKEPEERVYLKVTASELLVSCSVDTDVIYLSRYAYFALYRLTYYHSDYDFEDLYWPGFFDQHDGASKYLMIHKSKDSIHVSSKARYSGFYKPGKQFPVLSETIPNSRIETPVIKEILPKQDSLILGFCLADANNDWHRTNHYPFLIPYTATLNKNKTAIRGFKTYVLHEKQLPENLSDEQQRLVEICFAMKKIALVRVAKNKEDEQLLAQIQDINRENYHQLFALWQQALPLLAGRLYTHYWYTFGMYNVKGKPARSRMQACVFQNKIPEICFKWKDLGNHYKLELRLKCGSKDFQMSYYYNTAFFALLSQEPRNYGLLNSITDSDLILFFQKSHYHILILKKHYDSNCKHFLDQLRERYQFIKSKNPPANT